MKTILNAHRQMVVTGILVAASAFALAGCGARTATESSNPTPNPTATPAPGALPQMHPANLRGVTAKSADAYEPNDVAPYYLGAGVSYTVADGYIDPVDVKWTMDVVNDGGEALDSFDVALHVGDQILTQTLDGIGAGETRTVTFMSTGVVPGTVTAFGVVDTRSDVAESDELDNTSPSIDIAVTADEDCFSVYEISGHTLTITLDQMPFDYDLELLDPAGVSVASSRNAGLTAESISFVATSSGNWEARVTGYNGAGSATAPYRLQIQAP
jgi:hypothetical protein